MTSRSRASTGALAAGAERQLDRQAGGVMMQVGGVGWSLRKNRSREFGHSVIAEIQAAADSGVAGGRRGPSFRPNFTRLTTTDSNSPRLTRPSG
jgi:hypothetical protein